MWVVYSYCESTLCAALYMVFRKQVNMDSRLGRSLN